MTDDEPNRDPDTYPRLESVIGLEDDRLMTLLSRLNGRDMAVAMTDLSQADREWFASHFRTRAMLLILEEAEAQETVDPGELSAVRRVVAGVIRDMVAAGELPHWCLGDNDRTRR
ncbi:MAG: hypothetical protein JO128_19060 [Alphaproteobacteria bacterium]|nr:hypothetical protein [Alphaproteobacteria bacterium]